MRTLAVIVVLSALLTGCQDTPPPQSTAISTRSVLSLLKGSAASTPAVLEAKGVQEPIGGSSGLGPTDYQYFGLVKLESDALEAFVSNAKPEVERPKYVRPQGTTTWWPNERDFNELEFFEHPSPSPGIIGWIAVSRKFGNVLFVLGTT